MAVRTVSVELKMKIADFLRGAGEAAAATKILGDEFDGLGKKSEKFSTAKPSREMQNFSRVINASLKDGQTGFQSIQKSIDDTKAHITNLRKEFATTGSASVFGDLKAAQKDLRTLESIFKEIAPSAGAAGTQAGSSFAGNFFKTFSQSTTLAESAGPVGIAIGVAVAAVATPVIVSALTAGIAGAIGLGIIGAGALIEKNNPAVQAAFAPLKNTISKTLTDAASPLQQSFVDALHSADAFVQREGPALKGMFASVAPAVGIVTGGIESLLSKLLPEFSAIGTEFSKAFANPQVHDALVNAENDFVNLFKTIGDNPQVIAVGFETIGKAISFVSGFVSGLINLTRNVINAFDSATSSVSKFFGGDTKSEALADKFSAINKQFPDLAANARDTTGIFSGLGSAISAAATGMGQFAQQAALAGPDLKTLESTLSATTVTADTLAGQMTDKLVGSLLAVDNANNNFNKSLVTVGDTIVNLGGNLTQHVKALKKSETGQQQETDAVLAAITANLQVYDSQIAVGVSSYDAAKAYDANSASLAAQVKAAGHVPPAVQKLIDKYAKVPDNVNTDITMHGLTDAINNLDTTLRLVNHIDGLHATAYIDTVYRTKGHPPSGPLARNVSRWGGVYEPAADGLLTHAQVYSPVNPGRFMIAEPATGGEAFIPKNGDFGRSVNILKAAAGWYGQRVVDGGSGGGAVNIMVSAAPGMPKEFLNLMRFAVQGAGGGVVQALTPR